MCAEATEVAGTGSGRSFGLTPGFQPRKPCPICVMEVNSDWRYSGEKYIINAVETGDSPPSPNFFDCLRE